MNEIPQNIAQTLLEQAAREADRETLTLAAHDGTAVDTLVARAGTTATILQDKLDTFAAIPRSRAGAVQALDLESFAGLVMRDHDPASVVFVDVSGPAVSFVAVLDYHRQAATEDNDKARDGQRWGRETITYSPALSDEWRAWTGQSGKPMTQGEFAAWIDDHLPDLADPRHLKDDPESTAARFGAVYGGTAENLYTYADPERMIKLSTGFSVRETSDIKSVINLTSGETRWNTSRRTGRGRQAAERAASIPPLDPGVPARGGLSRAGQDPISQEGPGDRVDL